VFGNRVLRRIFGPKREELAGSRRSLHNEELHILYTLPSIIRVLKSRRMRWEGRVTCTREMIMYMKFWSENLKGRDHSEDVGVDGRIILEWIIE
jgi:hypothetical protein